jgi:uncharacterized membrane protein YecN with MAPEG domain
MLFVTPLIASVLAIFYIRLTFGVIGLRQKHRISLGTGGNAELERAIRAHGNFTEYVPLALLLLAFLELNHAPLWLVAPLGLLLLTGRLLHAAGVRTDTPGASPNRVRGMVATLSTLMALVVCNVGWLVFQRLG